MPQHKRGPWSQTEDQYLLHLVNLHGAHNWVRISSTIQTRSPKQCRERFHQNLKPNLNHDPITPEEGVLIEQMVAEMGKRWAEIARRLRGRSDNAVKNWWNGGMNRRRRSNHSRRTELEVRQPHASAQSLPPPSSTTHHHSLPFTFPTHAAVAHEPFGQPMYHPSQMQHSASLGLPSNDTMLQRHSGLLDTPLPSPSAFSQMSAEGVPSLLSDTSSNSGRSPHYGPSPIELPPLSGYRDERRRSSGPLARRVLTGSLGEGDFSPPPPLSAKQPSHMPQQTFTPQHPIYAPATAYPHPVPYLPSQPRQTVPEQLTPRTTAHGYAMPPNSLLKSNPYPHAHTPLPSTAPFQLPSISRLEVPGRSVHRPAATFTIDPALTQVHIAPSSTSPKDKMSLSNLTH